MQWNLFHGTYEQLRLVVLLQDSDRTSRPEWNLLALPHRASGEHDSLQIPEGTSCDQPVHTGPGLSNSAPEANPQVMGRGTAGEAKVVYPT